MLNDQMQRINELESALEEAEVTLLNALNTLEHIYKTTADERRIIMEKIGQVRERITGVLQYKPDKSPLGPGFSLSYGDCVNISSVEGLPGDKVLVQLRIGDQFKAHIEMTHEQLNAFPHWLPGYSGGFATWIPGNPEGE